jgi:hypothetical protein
MSRAGRSLAAVAVAVVALVAVTAAVATPGIATPVRFTCYPAQFGSWQAQTRTLSDRLSFARAATSVSIGAPQTVCTPSSGASSGYLVCYAARSRTVPQATYSVSDEFARSFSVTVQALGALCVPSARVDQSGSASIASGTSPLSCYTTRTSVPLRSVAVSDVFGSSKDSLVGPLGLCSPAAWKPPLPDGSFLTCYTDQAATTGTVVVLRSEFGYLKAALGPRASLCTPASVTGGGLLQPYARAAH